MKRILSLFCLCLLLASCADTQQKAIQTLCKGVNTTGASCGGKMGMPGQCEECQRENELLERVANKAPDLSSMESKENSLLW